MLNLIKHWLHTSIFLQVTICYSPMYEIQEIPYYSHSFPLQLYNSYEPLWRRIEFNTAPTGLVNYQHYYDTNSYLYPYTSYKYSFIKCPTRPPYKRESIKHYSPYNTIHYYVKQNNKYPQKLNYINFIPGNEHSTQFHENYLAKCETPGALYHYRTYPVNQKSNYSNICNTIFSNIDSLPYCFQNLQYSQNKIPTYQYRTSTPTSTINILRVKEENCKKVQFMFPSEIVIKSLGPWASTGDTGEYRSNGTFSIRYDISKPIDISNSTTTNLTEIQFVNNAISYNGKYENSNVESKQNKVDNLLQIKNNKNKRKKLKRNHMFGGSGKDLSLRKASKHCEYQNAVLETYKTAGNRKHYSNKIKEEAKHSTSNKLNKSTKLNQTKLLKSNVNGFKKSNYVPESIKKRAFSNHKRRQRKIGKRPSIPNSRALKIYTEEPITELECLTHNNWFSDLIKLRDHENETTTYKTQTQTTNKKTTNIYSNNFSQPLLTEESIVTTVSQIPLVQSSGDNSRKSECEQKYKARCICSIRVVLGDLEEIISYNNESKNLLMSLSNYSCKSYRPIPRSYKISAQMKPRLISNKQKELLVDDGPGPKEIVAETMDELMTRGIPNEGIDFYVFPSTNIEVPCITTNEIQLSPNTADSTKYTWTHGNQKEITEGRITEDLHHRGSLLINGVTMEDSDNYTCTVNYTSPDTELQTSNSFLHTVLVVSEPLLALHALIHYNAKTKCDQELLEMFELYIPQQIEDIICENDVTTKFCNIEIHNPMCHTKFNQEAERPNEKKSFYEIPHIKKRWSRETGESRFNQHMEMSLNYELDTGDIWKLMPSTDNKTHCSPYCQQRVLLKVIEILRESIVDALTYPIESSVGIVFEPDVTSMNVKIIIACSGGLQLYQGFCVPCRKGYYSDEGSTRCTRCPPGTYQDKIGAKICEMCPHPFKEGCFEMWYSPIMITMLAAAVLIVILLCCLLMYFCRSRGGGKISGASQLNKKYDTHPKNKKMKKQTKKKQKTMQNNQGLPPPIPSEDFSV